MEESTLTLELTHAMNEPLKTGAAKELDCNASSRCVERLVRVGVEQHRNVCRHIDDRFSMEISTRKWAFGIQAHSWGIRVMVWKWHLCFHTNDRGQAPRPEAPPDNERNQQ